jgi:hypothetical protein
MGPLSRRCTTVGPVKRGNPVFGGCGVELTCWRCVLVFTVWVALLLEAVLNGNPMRQRGMESAGNIVPR